VDAYPLRDAEGRPTDRAGDVRSVALAVDPVRPASLSFSGLVAGLSSSSTKSLISTMRLVNSTCVGEDTRVDDVHVYAGARPLEAVGVVERQPALVDPSSPQLRPFRCRLSRRARPRSPFDARVARNLERLLL